MIRFLSGRTENIVGKGDNGNNQHFLLFYAFKMHLGS